MATAQAAYIPSDCKLKIGGRCFTAAEVTRFESGTLTTGGGIILISGNDTAGGATNFRKKDGTDFVVGAGVTLKVKAGLFYGSGTSGPYHYKVTLGHSTVAVAYNTSGTSPVYYGGANVSAIATNATDNGFALDWDVPTGKYPFYMSGAGGGTAMIWAFID